MTKRRRAFFVIFVLVLASLSCRTVGQPAQATPENPSINTSRTRPAPAPTSNDMADDEILFIDYVYTENLITSLYHLYGSVLDNFVDITITNDGREDVSLVVETEVEGYTTRARDTVEVPAGESLTIHQNPMLIPEAVDQLNAQKPGNFHILVTALVEGEDEILLDETQSILVYSRRDFVWVPGFEWWEEYELWAAWVTPNDPAVEELIRAAANYDPTGIMTSGYGYEPNDGDGSVYRRLEAIWEAEAQDYQLTYISTMTTFAPGTVQRMRLPAEVLDQSSGNCVELAALFASAAEALGLEAAIIRIPGHAYVGIRTDKENALYYFIETTMIGRASFGDAVDYGGEEWSEAEPHFDAGEEGYAWVTIPDAREKGILPIPWR